MHIEMSNEVAYTKTYSIIGGEVTEYRDKYGNILEMHVDRTELLSNKYSHTDVYDKNNVKIGYYVDWEKKNK